MLATLAAIRAELGAKIDAIDAKVDAHRAETAKGFAALDRELTGHADPIHRDIERDIEKLRGSAPGEAGATPIARAHAGHDALVAGALPRHPAVASSASR
ncbi:MAG: hypothetical protein KF837_15440 [Labilithrix sp.]|nr:hypothetical protein [Labilithrix sp.]